jgi:hypothetical protein
MRASVAADIRSIFNSVLRLVTAILMETSEEWETGKSYLNHTAPHSLETTRN